MTTTCRAFNKDCDTVETGVDDLLGSMPDGTGLFCSSEFDASIESVVDGGRRLIYVGHVNDGQAVRIEEHLAGKNVVFIRCSSAGRAGHAHRTLDQLVVLELLPDFRTVQKQDWARLVTFLTSNPAVPSEIVRGDVPDELRAFFGGVVSPNHLAALSILCQGYLAVQAGPKGEVEVEDPADDIEKALLVMRWHEVRESEEITKYLDSRLSAPDVDGRASLRREVTMVKYWNVFSANEGGAEALQEGLLVRAEKEWGKGADSDPAFEPVAALIKLLGRDVNQGDLVAKAYLALAKRFGAAGGA